MYVNDNIVRTPKQIRPLGDGNGPPGSHHLSSLGLFLEKIKRSGVLVPKEPTSTTSWYQINPLTLLLLRFRQNLPPESTNRAMPALFLGCDH